MGCDLQNMLQLVMSLGFLVLVLQSSWSLGQEQEQQQPPPPQPQPQPRLSSSIELSALYDLRSSLGLRSRDWPRKSDPCSRWVGVDCEGGRVVSINLNGLKRTRLGQLNPHFSVDALSNLTLLSTFNCSGFYLPGTIPNLSSSITVLDLRFSSILGTIPPSLLNMRNLTHLYLSGNALTGNIPQSLAQLSRLSVLNLSANSLVGPIPSSLSSLTNLTILDLSANFLSGPIPPSLGSLSTLTSLILSNNSLTGSIPSQLANLSRLLYLDLSFNSLSGSTPLENVFSALTQIQFLVLSHNDFSGTLPSQLWSLSDLRRLDVSYNNFTGDFPLLHSNSNATNAAASIFNISHNLFYGHLPPQLWTFGFISLSGNYFQGRVPEGNSGNASFVGNCLQEMSGQRTLADCESFYASRGLPFDGFGTPNTTNSAGSRQKNNRRLRFILAGVFGGLGFIVFVALVLALFLGRRKRDTGSQIENGAIPAPSGDGPPPPSGISINLSSLGEAFTYEQLLRATADFSDTNLIKHGHTGDLYQGILEGGIIVVVKRIDVRAVKRDAYMVELDFFSRASHTRLVPLLGHCLENENEKLLVYKYMPNGDLSNALYRKTSQEEDSLQSLDWITRLKIATGAAEALSYLHHDCTPPLVHRDVQASSILLDDKFEVRLGSLCEICTQEGDTHQNVITRLLRLSQTSEQGLSGSSTSTATCAYDVFCLGKVLLELVTGKMGISGLSNETSTNELLEYVLPCISIYDKESVTKIVDPSLIVDEDLLEEVWAMAIVAKSCLNPKPSKRPLMRYILKALENPLKVVREENSSSARLRTMSSRGSWNAAIFGSWRHSSSDIPGPNREGTTSSLKQSGDSQGSGGQGGGVDLLSSNKRVSKEIFPEPLAFGRDSEERPEED